MALEEFTKVRNTNFTFDDIWRIYDSQFDTIRNFLLALGDKYEVQAFSGANLTDNVLTISGTYGKNQLFLYVNGVMQWKDIDYLESSSNTITLLNPVKQTASIKVMIINSNTLQNSVDDYISSLNTKVKEIEDKIKRLEEATNKISELEIEVNKISDLETAIKDKKIEMSALNDILTIEST